MIKIRNCVLCLFLMQTSHNYGVGFTKETEIIAKGIENSAQTFSKSMPESSSRLGENAVGALGSSIEKSADKISEALPKTASAHGKEAAEVLGSSIERSSESVATTIRNGLHFITGVYAVGKAVVEMKNYFYPSEERIAQNMKNKDIAAKYEQSYQRRVCENELKECFINNRCSERSESGVPIACQDVAQRFVVHEGNADKLNKLTEAFNEVCKK